MASVCHAYLRSDDSIGTDPADHTDSCVSGTPRVNKCPLFASQSPYLKTLQQIPTAVVSETHMSIRPMGRDVESYWYQDHVEAPSEQEQEVQKEKSIPEGHCAPLNEEIPEMDHQGWRRHHAALAT